MKEGETTSSGNCLPSVQEKEAFGVKDGGFFSSWVRQDHLYMDLRIICLEVRIFISKTITWNAL